MTNNNKEGQLISGGEILMESLLAQGIDTIFGYPGGAIMPVYDRLYDYTDRLRHILVRHEQGAIHAAQGYARVQDKPGCVLVTSGPGATNVITGIADAMIDSTPVVVIAGQVPTNLLGTDAFQEIDLVGMTSPIAKWSYQIRRPEDVAWAVARAFYIAKSGRPGPVVLDFTKDAQIGKTTYVPGKCDFIRSYVPCPKVRIEDIGKAVDMIDASKNPLVVYGQGIILSKAEKELISFLEKGDFPAGSTLLGLSAVPSRNTHFIGMLGMHGNIAPNILTQECDLLIAVGMRFDDRVTGKLSTYAKNAKVIHIDIDRSELSKNVPVDLAINGDAKEVLKLLTKSMKKVEHRDWHERIVICKKEEKEMVINPELRPGEGPIKVGEVVDAVNQGCAGNAIIVTDVGENQMIAARYSRFTQSRSFLTSGGLGTMGFGLPAGIGAKIGAPDRQVCVYVGDGGFQMTIEELGTIAQEGTGVKVVLIDNTWLGNVRLWQQLFFNKRYSFTKLANPDFEKIAEAYGIKCVTVEKREELADAVKTMFADDKPFILNARVMEENMVFPMIPPGKSVDQIMLNETQWYKE